MASFYSPRTWKYRVFTSFHGPDARKTLLSHLRKQFSYNGISMFNDQEIERSQIIGPAVKQAIWESRISIVVLSKNYASSSWCLDELLEILECEKDHKQIVMTVFYGVDPYDVRKQSGNFGKAFNATCRRKTKKERQKWSNALKHVAEIAGEHFLNWDSESKMIEKIARDVSDKLNASISWDFEDMVGIEAHLQKMQSLLHLDCEDEAMIVGISGPAGIGKTTIARALHCRLSSSFQLTCFMENVRGSYNRGLDEYGLKLCLQEQLLSKILNQNGVRIFGLSAIPNRLNDQKVLIILDDVDDLEQLEALANESDWFGPGSRIIVTTEDQELLEQHDINNIYQVDFPTKEEACEIFCIYAFRQKLAPHGFENLADRVTKLCSNLPLGLRVMGSTLRGKIQDDREDILHRLENGLHRKIEGVLRVGYDHLHKDDQYLFLFIALFFNYVDDNYVKAMLADSNLDVRLGLKTLAYKSLIQISSRGEIVMHKLLQQVGREAAEREVPGKQQILIRADKIRDVINSGSTGFVTSISLDMTTIPKWVRISAGDFKRMENLLFLNIYNTRFEIYDRMHVPEDMDFPPSLRLIRWEKYPMKSLPHTFSPQYLVELNLEQSKCEKLWEGTQLLPNLKKMDLTASMNLKELPDLSNAMNLENLVLRSCFSLVEIPSSIGNLHKLKELGMNYCINLQVVPTHFNLASLESLRMMGCRQLQKIPEISTNITRLFIEETVLEVLPRLSSRLEILSIHGYDRVNFPQFRESDGKSIRFRNERSVSTIKKIPDWIKDLHGLRRLHILGCSKLASLSLTELPSSLRVLMVEDCGSLETVYFGFKNQIKVLGFLNCYKLGQKAKRRVIANQSSETCITGKNIPVEFVHLAVGNSLTIRSSFYRFRICVVLSPEQPTKISNPLRCRISIRMKGCSIDRYQTMPFISSHSIILGSHLFMCFIDLPYQDGLLKQDNEVSFEFNTIPLNINITECGVQILSEKPTQSIEANEAMVLEQNKCLIRDTFSCVRSKLIIYMYKIFIFFLFVFLLILISDLLFIKLFV